MSALEGERSRFRHISVITLPFFLVSVDQKNSSYFCVFKYARAVKQKDGNKAENRARLGRDVIFSLSSHARRACEARALRPCKTLSPRFTDFFSDFEKNPTVLQCIVFVTFPVTHFFSFL